MQAGNMNRFDELNLAEPIIRAVREKGYETPTPIQQQAIPVVLQGKDIFGIARTGTGKTAAFALPILEMLGRTAAKNAGGNRGIRPIRALVLTPTRELALQIEECFGDYAKYTGLRHTVIFGGVKQGPQVDSLRRGVDILVATPGRLLDLIGQGFVHLDAVTHFVLDEADRMLDMGFITDVRRLLPLIPVRRQTLFFSATLPKAIVSLAGSILNHPVRVEVTPPSTTVEMVRQRICYVDKPEKKAVLLEVLRSEEDGSVLVFSRTKHGADKLARVLQKAGIAAEALHGDKSQGQRQRAMAGFKSGRVRVMVATDIAARGIDVHELPLVVNFDLPDVAETYVHRIGRTGRAGCAGTALTLCSPEERGLLADIQKLTGGKLQPVQYTA